MACRRDNSANNQLAHMTCTVRQLSCQSGRQFDWALRRAVLNSKSCFRERIVPSFKQNRPPGSSFVMNQEVVIHEIQQRYRKLSHCLNEFERRHWAATEDETRSRRYLGCLQSAANVGQYDQARD